MNIQYQWRILTEDGLLLVPKRHQYYNWIDLSVSFNSELEAFDTFNQLTGQFDDLDVREKYMLIKIYTASYQEEED